MKRAIPNNSIKTKTVIASIFSSKRQEKLFARSVEKFMLSSAKKNNTRHEVHIEE